MVTNVKYKETFEEFKTKNVFDYDYDFLEHVWNNVKKYLNKKEIFKGVDYSEGSFNLICGDSLSSLFKEIKEITPDEIVNRYCNQFGYVIDFVYIKETDEYGVVLGFR